MYGAGQTAYAIQKEMAAPHAEEEEIVSPGTSGIASWDGVTPVEIELGLPPVVAVQYEANDRATMDLFAAILKSGEVSERVYNLTTEVAS